MTTTVEPNLLGRAGMVLSRRPGWGVAALLVLVILAGIGLGRESHDDALQDDEAWSFAAQTQKDFDLKGDGLVLALFGDVTTEAAGSVVRRMVERLEGLPWIEDVTTPWDFPGFDSITLAEAKDHAVVGATLVSENGMLLPYRLWSGGPSASEGGFPPTDWGAAMRRVVAEELARPSTGLEYGFTGKSAVIAAQGKAFADERWRFMIFGALLGFVVASLAFRNLRATFLAGLPPLVGVVLSIGIARLLGLGGTNFTTLVLPLLVLTIGFADSLHVVVAMVRARQEGGAKSGSSAAVQAMGEMTWPCALTSLTTAIGFASLSITGNALVVDFGLSCALATAITFVTVVVVIPLLARTPLGARLEAVNPPRFDAGDDDPSLATPGLVARAVRSVIDFSLRAPRTVAIIGFLLTAASVWVASGLEADRRVMSDLADGSEAADVLRRVDAELGGVFPVHVRMDWDEGVTGAELKQYAQRIGTILSLEPEFAGAMGPAEILGVLGTEVPWSALRLVPERWRTRLVDFDQRSALVHARVADVGSRVLIPAFERVRRQLEDMDSPQLRLRLVGSHIAYLETVDEVTKDLARSLVLAAVIILLTLALAFRSWRLGLASVVPNLLPLAVSAAGLALVGGRVDVSTLTALTLSLGIATDDTIHVLAQWRRIRPTAATAALAARGAILRTLPALTLTTLTLTAAFGQVLTSALPTIRNFGLLASITLVVAFLADALLLPSILVVLDGKRVRSKPDPAIREPARSVD